MTIGLHDLARFPGPAYRVLADSLAEAIDAGRLRAGARLPPQRDLAFNLRVTTGTVGRAYDLLAQRGLARGEVGRGTFVLDRAVPGEAAWGEPTLHGGDGPYDLTANFPAPVPAQTRLGELLPADETAADLLGDLLQYPPIAGALRHRRAAAEWLAHLDLAVEPDHLVLTNGTEGGLAAALLALGRPGDAVLAEALCYSGLRSLAARLGQHLHPVAMDDDGVLPEALAAAARHTGARVVVVSPNLHNPTNLTMSAERRAAIVAVARRCDLLVIEDDVYGPLLPARPSALASLMPERTLHLTSVSKFLAPGLRLGFLHGPPDLVREVTATQRDLSLGHAPLAAELFARALRTGVIASALEQQRLELRARQEIAAALLAGLDTAAQPTALHLWLRLPEVWTSAEAALALARSGVMVAPAERFAIHRGAVPAAIRLSISAPPTRAHLRAALTQVACTLAAAGSERDAVGLV